MTIDQRNARSVRRKHRPVGQPGGRPRQGYGGGAYPADLVMEDMLQAKILFAGRPHARVLAIDTTEAEAVPDVVAILTAKDVPVNEYGLQTADQPVLCGPGSTRPGADVVRFVGDQVALVVAETEGAAIRARDLIRVEYQDLPVLIRSVRGAQARRAPTPSGQRAQ